MADNSIITLSGICTGMTQKALFFKQSGGNIATYPLSQVTVVSGELSNGAAVTLSVPQWLVERAAQGSTAPKQDDIQFTARVLVTGVLVDRSEKALFIRCDADMVSRWLALSKIEIDGDLPTVPGTPVRLFVPAWMLRHKTGHFPSWVRGAVI